MHYSFAYGFNLFSNVLVETLHARSFRCSSLVVSAFNNRLQPFSSFLPIHLFLSEGRVTANDENGIDDELSDERKKRKRGHARSDNCRDF